MVDTSVAAWGWPLRRVPAALAHGLNLVGLDISGTRRARRRDQGPPWDDRGLRQPDPSPRLGQRRTAGRESAPARPPWRGRAERRPAHPAFV